MPSREVIRSGVRVLILIQQPLNYVLRGVFEGSGSAEKALVNLIG